MVLVAISQCVVCGNEFPYRKSKQFRSNACKQQAYLSSKAGVPLVPIVSKETHAFDFSLKEFEQYREDVNCGMDLLQFCFFRRTGLDADIPRD